MTSGGVEALAQAFLSSVLTADNLHERRDSIIRAAPAASQSGPPWFLDVEYAEVCLAAASVYLGAATNSLIALRLLTLPNPTPVDGQLSASITLNGTAGLLRQSMECAATACWLLESPDAAVMQQRGFAAAWDDAMESLNYARAADEPRLDEWEKQRDVLINDGQRLGLLVENRNPPGWKPRHPIVDSAGLLRRVTLTRELRGTPGGGASASGLGPNAEFLYRWLSGMAHGRAWGHGVPGMTEPVLLVAFQPDYLRLALSASVAARLASEGIALMEKRFTEGSTSGD